MGIDKDSENTPVFFYSFLYKLSTNDYLRIELPNGDSRALVQVILYVWNGTQERWQWRIPQYYDCGCEQETGGTSASRVLGTFLFFLSFSILY
jgi:hypothetical protein